MKYWLTQSLLNSWIHWRESDEQFEPSAWESFLSALRCTPQEPTRAMLNGRKFEAMVNTIVAGYTPEDAPNGRWVRAADQFARICSGGQPQVRLADELSAYGLELCLFGIADYVKAGTIYDIKKVGRYEYGKYLQSPQHPMYLHLLPQAMKFTYLIFDGTRCYKETYRRPDAQPIQEIITEFLGFLDFAGLLDTYKTNWAMTPRREERFNDVYRLRK